MATRRSNANYPRVSDAIKFIAKRPALCAYLWLYEGGSQDIVDYLNSKNAMKRLDKTQKEKIRGNDPPEDYDLSLLYKLIQFSCGLEDQNHHIWSKPTTPQEQDSLEHNIYLLKEKRNNLCHEDTLCNLTFDELELQLQELSQLCEAILQKAGNKAGRQHQEVKDEIDRMKKDLQELMRTPLESGMTEEEFCRRFKEETEKHHKTPPVSIKEFVPLQLQSKGNCQRDIKDFPKWKCDNGSRPKAIIIKGEPGTGKTTLCGYIFESWISGRNEIHKLHDEKDKLENEVPKLQDEIARLENEILKLQDEIDKMQDDKSKLEDEIPESQDKFVKLQDEKAKLENEIPKRQDEIDKLHDEKAKLENEIPKLQDESTKLQEKISNLQAITGELKEFDIVIPIRAYTVSTNNIVEFLQSLAEETMSLCNKKDILPFLRSQRILWLIDSYEESTKVGTQLVKEIFSLTKNASHLILLTTQPQQDLSHAFSIHKDSMTEAQLIGFSKEGVQEFIQNMLDAKHNDFRDYIDKMDKDSLKEICIPIKLKLTVELWDGEKLGTEPGSSFYVLYKKYHEMCKEKLEQKLKRETSLDDAQIDKRCQSWINVLSKTAFDMLVNHNVMKIPNELQQQLKDEAERLIYPDYCLSLFLRNEGTGTNITNMFVHSTQQINLASQYIISLIKEKQMIPEKFKEFVRPDTPAHIAIPDKNGNLVPIGRTFSFSAQIGHTFSFSALSCQVVSGIAEISNNIERCVIRDLVRVLCPSNRARWDRHFSSFSGFRPLEILKYVDCNRIFVEEIRKSIEYSNDEIEIRYGEVKTALAVLPILGTSDIIISFSKNPEDKHEFQQLLEQISGRDSRVQLTFENRKFKLTATTSFHDDYLNELCCPDAKCHLTKFEGALSMNGVRFLKEMKEVEELTLRAPFNGLHQILNALEFLKRLKCINLILEMQTKREIQLSNQEKRIYANLFDMCHLRQKQPVLPFSNQSDIVVWFFNNPEDKQELQQISKMISGRDSRVQFIDKNASKESTTITGFDDDYLNVLCCPDAKCHLTKFIGALSINGVRFLKEMKEVKVLMLRVSSNEVLHQILNNLEYLKQLDSISLILEMRIVNASPNMVSIDFFQRREIDLNIMLKAIDASEVNETADAFANMSKRYNIITLSDASKDTCMQKASKLFQRLKEKNVYLRAIEYDWGEGQYFGTGAPTGGPLDT